MKPICPHCKGKRVQKRGNYPRQRYQCLEKKHPEGLPRYWTEEKSKANVILFDLETLPMKVFAWRLGEQNWSPDNIIQDRCILSYSWKKLFSPTVHSAVLTPKEAVAYNDKRLVEDLHAIMNGADIVIAHNGNNFDIPVLNTRVVKYGLPPISPYQSIDTRTTAKRAFGFSSNKLAYLATYLGLPSKLHTDFDLWKQCVDGNPAALEYMRKYNAQDIWVLEDVYVQLRPFIKHPNMSLFTIVDGKTYVCPHCGGNDCDSEPAKYRTDASLFDLFRCNNCGAVGRWYKRGYSSASRSIMK